MNIQEIIDSFEITNEDVKNYIALSPEANKEYRDLFKNELKEYETEEELIKGKNLKQAVLYNSTYINYTAKTISIPDIDGMDVLDVISMLKNKLSKLKDIKSKIYIEYSYTNDFSDFDYDNHLTEDDIETAWYLRYYDVAMYDVSHVHAKVVRQMQLRIREMQEDTVRDQRLKEFLNSLYECIEHRFDHMCKISVINVDEPIAMLYLSQTTPIAYYKKNSNSLYIQSPSIFIEDTVRVLNLLKGVNIELASDFETTKNVLLNGKQWDKKWILIKQDNTNENFNNKEQ